MKIHLLARFAALSLISLVSLSTPVLSAPAAPLKLMPLEESIRDPELARALRELLLITGRRDKAALLAYLDPKLRCSFGGCAGVAGFTKLWKLDQDPAKSPLWPVLEDMLLLGGAYDAQGTGNYYVPYVYARFPESRDAFEYVAITGRDVQIRSAPKFDSPVLAKVSYEILRDTTRQKQLATLNGRTYPWHQVQLADGRTGYVWGRYVYSPVGYRLGLSKTPQGWKIDFFVAGD